MGDDQPASGVAAQRAQVAVQRRQASQDELNPAVLAWQSIENFGVKDKDAKHIPALGARLQQGGIVVSAQIAPEPHQAGLELFFCDHR